MWNEAAWWLYRVQVIAQIQHTPSEVAHQTANTAMPWWLFGNMTEADLGAIYEYLRTVEPVNNTITRYQPLPGTARVQTNWSERAGT